MYFIVVFQHVEIRNLTCSMLCVAYKVSCNTGERGRFVVYLYVVSLTPQSLGFINNAVNSGRGASSAGECYANARAGVGCDHPFYEPYLADWQSSAPPGEQPAASQPGRDVSPQRGQLRAATAEEAALNNPGISNMKSLWPHLVLFSSHHPCLQ